MPLKLMYIPYQEAFIRIIDDYKCGNYSGTLAIGSIL